MSPRNASPARKAHNGNFPPAPITESSRICEDTWVPLGDAVQQVLALLERQRAAGAERSPAFARWEDCR